MPSALQYRYGQASKLEVGEAAMVALALLKADVLLVPHHGSKTSSSGSFLDAVHPALAIVQAGYRNRFGHPAPLVLDRYRVRKISVFESARCGAARSTGGSASHPASAARCS